MSHHLFGEVVDVSVDELEMTDQDIASRIVLVSVGNLVGHLFDESSEFVRGGHGGRGRVCHVGSFLGFLVLTLLLSLL